eukprot:gene1174-1283_t
MGIVLDEEDDLPACRICQTTQSEMPEKVLIRPCLCSGSQAFVHVDCLNQWRATSSEAFTKCSICQYQYQIKRSVWTSLLSHSFTVSALCSGAFLCTCLLIGLVFHFTTKKLAPHKSFIPEMISEWIMKEIIGWSEGEALDCLVPEVRQGVADLLRDTLSSLDYEEKGGYYSSPSFSPVSLLSYLQDVICCQLFVKLISLRCDQTVILLTRCLLLGMVLLGIVGQIFNIIHFTFFHYLGFLVTTVFYGRSVDGAVRVWMLMGCYALLMRWHDYLTDLTRRVVNRYQDQVMDRVPLS